MDLSFRAVLGRTIPIVVALSSALLAACSGGDDILPPPTSAAAELRAVTPKPHPGIPGAWAPDSVVVEVLDGQGKGVPGVAVTFSVEGGGGSLDPAVYRTDGQGRARTSWLFGEEDAQALLARVDGLAPLRVDARVVRVSGTAATMLPAVGNVISWAREVLQGTTSTNPAVADLIRDRLAVLSRPGLGGEILAGGRWVEGALPAPSAAPVLAVFPVEGMQQEAERAVRYLEGGMPVVTAFLGLPFPSANVQIWYGFTVGSYGGGGTLYMEDRGTYESRIGAGGMPYDAILVHEVSHSYVGSESLTQFLELYAYNVPRSGSTDSRTWTHQRGWVPGAEPTEGVHALLEVYVLVGPEAMASAYRAVIPMRPPYGQPLSPAARQAFVDVAPPEAKARVAALMEKVTT
jgi:hypothetical protein